MQLHFDTATLKPQPLTVPKLDYIQETIKKMWSKTYRAGGNHGLKIPDGMKGFQCKPEDMETYVKAFNETELITEHLIEKHVKPLEPHVIRIQRQFRLWQWRLRVVFNPHTEIGHLNNMIHANLVIKDF